MKINNVYKDKVRLLLRILPIVMDEECFAIHGGTAINLFVNDLLRLSVDIDLTYIPLEERPLSINHINEALVRISSKIEEYLKGVRVIPRPDICKLTCEYHGCQVKIEVNQTKRGIVGGEPVTMTLCAKAQEIFEMEVEAKIVPLTQLYGGKIAAALSRQHPRDMFDINHMNISFDKAKYGFIFCLLGSDRPIYESFAPSFIDQKEAMEKQFAGMSNLDFTYDDYKETRRKLIENVRNIMTEEDKHFLISFEQGNPKWEKSAYGEFANYPSVKWKLLNLSKLKKSNPKKLEREAGLLEDILMGK
jgi:predicted nucleotidyltransferase component of viral defense system